MTTYKTVTIPARDEHEGLYARTVTLAWVCPVCGGPRGEPYDALSYDGSRRLHVHCWNNPCGHVDKYAAVRSEAEKAIEAQDVVEGSNLFDEALDQILDLDTWQEITDVPRPSYTPTIISASWMHTTLHTITAIETEAAEYADPADTPLPDDIAGLVELAEGIADGLEDGSVMLLDEAETAFMQEVCRFEGMFVYPHQTAGIRMAERLEAGGLVTVDRVGPFWIVSAVRGGGDE